LCWDKPLKTLRELAASPLRRQIAETLRRARKLPPGPHRNDLRQLASGLLLLHKTVAMANPQTHAAFTKFSSNG
jgi:hypothetical protein